MLSLLFYEAQRSGPLPPTKRIPWRGDSALYDRGEKGEDLTGGYSDEGQKVMLPAAWTTTVLAWGVLEFEDAYRDCGEYANVLDALRWSYDYMVRPRLYVCLRAYGWGDGKRVFLPTDSSSTPPARTRTQIKAHTAPDELYVQVGGQRELSSWGPPEVVVTGPRIGRKITCSNPGTEPAAEAAAALAVGSMVFAEADRAYALQLLKHARQLYDFADRCRGSFVSDGHITEAAPFYR